MSWYGTHATISKFQVKEVIPAKACKRCVYFVRVVWSISVNQGVLPFTGTRCTRCECDLEFEVRKSKFVVNEHTAKINTLKKLI